MGKKTPADKRKFLTEEPSLDIRVDEVCRRATALEERVGEAEFLVELHLEEELEVADAVRDGPRLHGLCGLAGLFVKDDKRAMVKLRVAAEERHEDVVVDLIKLIRIKEILPHVEEVRVHSRERSVDLGEPYTSSFDFPLECWVLRLHFGGVGNVAYSDLLAADDDLLELVARRVRDLVGRPFGYSFDAFVVTVAEVVVAVVIVSVAAVPVPIAAVAVAIAAVLVVIAVVFVAVLLVGLIVVVAVI